ncbi:MAG: toll/interleukin-1 receptor domain-containing protein [Methylococcaceae bacterium]
MTAKIYVSYNWKVENEKKIVEKLEAACQQRGIILLRDKNEVNYKDSIRSYMNELASGDAIILVLSDAYFKSRYCMYEICRAHDKQNFSNRIFPIVVSGTKFHKTAERTPYIRYWEKEKKELEEDLKTIAMENMSSRSHEELKEYDEYCRLIDEYLEELGDKNTLTEDNHVDTDFEAILDLIQPAKQQADSPKRRLVRLPDEQFRDKIRDEIQVLLDQQRNLSDSLKVTLTEETQETLADFLCNKEFETAIDDYLYPATKQSLSEVEFNSKPYENTWEAAKSILSWLSLLVVSKEWVEEQANLKCFDGFSFQVQVKTACGIEVASARFRQFLPKLEAMTGKAAVQGQGGILPPQLNSGWGKDMPLERILIEIWNKVFPEDTRQPVTDKLSDVELSNLNKTLATREQRKTHHYYIPIPENQAIASQILKELSSITIIYLTSSANQPTLRIEDEGLFTSVIREFLTMKDN